ncbi:MAG: PAS domain-containing sensor histidine kinase [Myxococcales bacterium]|nr:PAS domain-containing sensor histidine kinase [Myxococcales bacterium]
MVSRDDAPLPDPSMVARHLLEHTSAVAFVKDAAGRYLFVNPAFEALVQQTIGGPDTADPIASQTDSGLWSSEVRDHFRAVDAMVLREGSAVTGLLKLPHADGDHYWLADKVALPAWDGGAWLGGVAIDVTPMVQRDRTLWGVLEAVIDPMLTVDRNGIVTWVNPAFTRELGWGEADLAGRAFAELVAPQDAGYAGAVLQQAAGAKDATVWQGTLLARSGTARFVEVSFCQLADDGVVGVVTDLTERRRTETQQRLFAEVFARAGQAMAVLDATGTTIAVNAAWETVTGIAPAAEVGRTAALFGPDRRSDPALRAAFLALAENGQWQGEREIPHPDGAARLLHMAVSAVPGDDGATGHYLVVYSDITERRRHLGERQRLESQLQQAQKLESLGRLAGGVAHDFNNLLTAIAGHADMIDMDAAQGSATRDSARTIGDACRRAGSVVRQLLAFARQLPGEAVAVDLSAAVRAMQRMLARTVRADIDLQLDLQTPLPAVVADPGHVDQVLLNLVVNAAEAMPSGGILTVRTRGDEDEASVVLLVEDTGVGIEPDQLAHIFEPFWSTKQAGGGTGLGLATVHGIVARLGGRIDVTSRIGVGTRFTVTLPAADSVPSPEPPADAPGLRPALHGRVLFVEDDGAVRRVGVRALMRAGYAVREAADGLAAKALALADSERCELLVSDLVMPRLGGVDLAISLRARWPGLPVLFVTGHTDVDVIDAALSLAGARLMQKPYSPRALLDAVDEMLAAARRRSA